MAENKGPLSKLFQWKQSVGINKGSEENKANNRWNRSSRLPIEQIHVIIEINPERKRNVLYWLQTTMKYNKQQTKTQYHVYVLLTKKKTKQNAVRRFWFDFVGIR